MMPNLIVSTVGTSLLTNYATGKKDSALNQLLRDTANAGEKELAAEQKAAIDSAAAAVEVLLQSAAPRELTSLSAELNGLYSYYGQDFWSGLPGLDCHVLLATDTYQGRKTAGLLTEHLKKAGIKSVSILVPRGLSTKNCGSFTAGVNEIIAWCEDTLPGYRQSRYRVVFNLVGGFKSLQGYMNTLGMFYADEIIYIFEAPTADIIRIPRLPVTMDDVPVLRQKASLFALMENGYLAEKEEVADVPEIYLKSDHEGCCTLSTWGLLVWKRNKRRILSGDLLEFPALAYENSFLKDYQVIVDKDFRTDIQSTLANVSLIYRERGLEGLRRDGGLLYKDYENRRDSSGRKIGHFRLNRGRRVSCVPDGQVLRLRRVGEHDNVNNNP
jgi:putative CRISPR-associated protein (TIGR02619 family)